MPSREGAHQSLPIDSDGWCDSKSVVGRLGGDEYGSGGEPGGVCRGALPS